MNFFLCFETNEDVQDHLKCFHVMLILLFSVAHDRRANNMEMF